MEDPTPRPQATGPEGLLLRDAIDAGGRLQALMAQLQALPAPALARQAAAVALELGKALQAWAARPADTAGAAAAVQTPASAAGAEPAARQALAVLLAELAGHADSASCVLGAAVDAGDLRLVDAADTIVRQVGALADRMAECLGEAPTREPDEWRLSARAVEAVAVLSDELAPAGLALEGA